MTERAGVGIVHLCSDCGVRPLRGQGTARIVGGEKSKFGDWPWQVGILNCD